MASLAPASNEFTKNKTSAAEDGVEDDEPAVPNSNKRARLTKSVISNDDGDKDDAATAASADEYSSLSRLPDVVLDSVVSCFTSRDMITQLTLVSKSFRDATERVAETLVTAENKKQYWSMMTLKKYGYSGCVEKGPPWTAPLYQQEHHVKETFHFDSLERAAQFFRCGLGRGSLTSFGADRDTCMFHAGFGGLVQFVGGVTPKNSMFAKAETTVGGGGGGGAPAGNSGVRRFIAQIYYRCNLRLGGRDTFLVGLVNPEYKPHGNEKGRMTKQVEKSNAASSALVAIPPLPKSAGKKQLLGITIDLDAKTMEVIKSAPTKATATGVAGAPANNACASTSRSFKKVMGPISFAVQQNADPRRSTMRGGGKQYGNHEFAVRESADDEEWNRLFPK